MNRKKSPYQSPSIEISGYIFPCVIASSFTDGGGGLTGSDPDFLDLELTDSNMIFNDRF